MCVCGGWGGRVGAMLETLNADMGTRRTRRGSFFMVFRSSGGLNAEGRLCKSGDAGPCWKLLECRSGPSFRRKQRGRSSEVLASRIEVGRSRFEVPGSARRRKKQPIISLQCPRGVARSQRDAIAPRAGPPGRPRSKFVCIPSEMRLVVPPSIRGARTKSSRIGSRCFGSRASR